MKATQAPSLKIETTKDYSKFKIMGGNRVISANHVNQLKREMEHDPELAAVEPILVNENMFIVDGQHRFTAAKELGLPVYYIVKSGATVETAARMNITQRRWTMDDFARSYADRGREDYIELLRIKKQFPMFNNSVLTLVLSGGRTNSQTDTFRRGDFKIADKEEAVERLELLKQVVESTGIKMNVPMASSFLQVLKNDDFEWVKFMGKLDAKPDMLVVSGIVRNCLRSIEDVYNHQSKTRARLY